MTSLFKMAFFRNLTPKRGDPRSPLARRFKKQRIAVVNLGAMGAKVGALHFVKGDPKIDNVVTLNAESNSNDYFPPGFFTAVKERSPDGAVVLGLSLKAVFSMTKFDQADVEILSGFNGDTRDPNLYAQTLPHAESDKTIRGMLERNLVAQVVEKFREHGLEVVRCQIPSITLLNRMLADAIVTAPADSSVNIPLVCDQGNIHAVAVSRGKWVGQRSTPIIARNALARRDDEDEEILDVLNSCRRSIDQSLNTRDASARPSAYNFLVVDTGTPALMERIVQLAPRMHGAANIKVSVAPFDGDSHQDLYCLAHDFKDSQ